MMISKKAKILKKVLGNIKFRKIISKMMVNGEKNNKKFGPPRNFYKKYNAKCIKINGRKCISLSPATKPEKHIIYFHGGGYTLQASRQHWKIADYILKETKSIITFVDYPLLPEYTCVDCINMVRKAYSKLIEINKEEVVLMGDSAGGGLALALALSLNVDNIEPKPSKIVLFSPWLDVSMQDNIPKELEARDLILDNETLKIVGKKYSDELDSKDYRCSPLYGELTDVGEIALFTGTSDILNVQANKLKDKMHSNSGNLHYYEYEEMQHVWMELPIPEAMDVMEKVIEFINH